MSVHINQAQLDKLLASGHTIKQSRSVAESMDWTPGCDELKYKFEKARSKLGINRNAMQQRRKDDRFKSNREREYAAYLAEMQSKGTIRRWAYEPIAFRLPDWGIFWPDFGVWLDDYELPELIELKGRGKFSLTDKGKAKYLDAKRLFAGFIWKMLQRTSDGWIEIL